MVSSFFHYESAVAYCRLLRHEIYISCFKKSLDFYNLIMQYTLVYISSESDHIIALKLLLFWYDCYGVNNLFRILCLKGLGNDSSLYLSFIISVPLSLRVREKKQRSFQWHIRLLSFVWAKPNVWIHLLSGSSGGSNPIRTRPAICYNFKLFWLSTVLALVARLKGKEICLTFSNEIFWIKVDPLWPLVIKGLETADKWLGL